MNALGLMPRGLREGPLPPRIREKLPEKAARVEPGRQAEARPTADQASRTRRQALTHDGLAGWAAVSPSTTERCRKPVRGSVVICEKRTFLGIQAVNLAAPWRRAAPSLPGPECSRECVRDRCPEGLVSRTGLPGTSGLVQARRVAGPGPTLSTVTLPVCKHVSVD